MVFEGHYRKQPDVTEGCVRDKGVSEDDFHPVTQCSFYKDSREKNFFFFFFSGFNSSKSHSPKHLACSYLYRPSHFGFKQN